MMSTILRELLLMASMVCTTSPTTAPPRSAMCDAFTARVLAERARSAFSRTVTVNCDMLAAVSAKEATWSWVRRARSLLPESISPVASEMESEDCLMPVTSSVNVSSMDPSAVSKRPKSPCRSDENSWLKSPAATVSAINRACLSGDTMALRSTPNATTATTHAARPSTTSHTRMFCSRPWAWSAARNRGSFCACSSPDTEATAVR